MQLLPGAWAEDLQVPRMVGSVAGTMLLRAAWRRASLAATSVALGRSSVPTRGLRLRGTFPFLFAPTVFEGANPLGSMLLNTALLRILPTVFHRPDS